MRRLAALLCAGLAACATAPGHEVFKQVMDRQVGKRADDPDFYPIYYRLRQLDSKKLPNGNAEDTYHAGKQGKCKLIFEVDAASDKVVRWRSEGDEGECVIVPAGTER